MGSISSSSTRFFLSVYTSATNDQIELLSIKHESIIPVASRLSDYLRDHDLDLVSSEQRRVRQRLLDPDDSSSRSSSIHNLDEEEKEEPIHSG